MTRPGVMLAAVLTGLWLAAFYSGNNLLYLCGAMLSALTFASIWQGVRLLKSTPPLAALLPGATEAGESFILRKDVPSISTQTGIVDVQWFGEQQPVVLQVRLDRPTVLTGRLHAEQRALIHLDRQRLTTTAPLGLWRISCWRDELSSWAVLPRPVAWVESVLSGARYARPFEGDELRDLRSYVPGDALSRIHWRKAASDASQWTVKRFEQHASELYTNKLRVDLRLPQSVDAGLFEELLGRVWYWVDSRLKAGEKQLKVVLGQQQFDLVSLAQREAFFMALAETTPQSSSPAGRGGQLLSLMEEG